MAEVDVTENLEMKKILFAGASSFFGLAEITDMLLKYEIRADYSENPDMIKYLSDDDARFVLIEENINATYDYIIPLNEYWVTKCKDADLSNISAVAFAAARSKIKLSDVMRRNGLNFCPYRRIDESLKNEIINGNKKFIIKPDGFYSGHGVSVLGNDNVNQIDDFYNKALFVNDNAKKVLNVLNNKPICVEYIHGMEYSADVFVHHENCAIVRVCKKKIAIIENKPCTLGYLLVEDGRYDEILNKWCKALFGENSVSFAQFDFIAESGGNKVIPIDFSCRIGGGLKKLFITEENNVYLRAIESIFERKEKKVNKPCYYNCQLNLTPCKSGFIKNNNYPIVNGKVYHLKPKNDRVIDAYSSANNRLAEIIQHINSEDEFSTIANACIVGSEYIENNKDATFRFIKYALEFGDIAYDERRLLLKINGINSYQDIADISVNDGLFDWKASLVYNLLGFEEYNNCNFNKQSSTTYILFPPTTQYGLECVKPILLSGIYETELFNLSFSRKLIAYIYGGFPWFESYVKYISELDIINKKTMCIRITNKNGSDILAELVDKKNMFRKENAHLILKKEYDKEFPGIINPFHTPNYIENDVHSAKILEEIEKWRNI